MILRHTTMNVNKSVLCLMACLLGSPAEAQDAPAEKTATQPSTEDRFEVRNLEGWTLYINRDVPKQYPEQTANTNRCCDSTASACRIPPWSARGITLPS